MKPKTPIYLDYAATTPVDERVAKAMCACLTRDGNFANPASRAHFFGWQAEAAVEKARAQLAALLHADPRSLVWTSGATESNNLAIKGLAYAHQARGKHIITSAIEHKATLDPCEYLEANGFEVTYLAPNAQGVISAAAVKAALRADTTVVALMHVNNELGSINPIAEIAEVCRANGSFLHVDAAQSVGKLALDVTALGAHTLSLSAHKFYGPKGIGALYVQREPQVELASQIHGGGHQRGMRSGTLPTHQIVGLGEAAAIAKKQLAADQKHMAILRDAFIQGLASLADIKRNGVAGEGSLGTNLDGESITSLEDESLQDESLDPDSATCVDGIVNISFANVEGETLLTALRDLAVSTGSACTSASVEPSYVLSALGVPAVLAHASLRFSFGRYTTVADIEYATQKIVTTVNTLRGLR